MSTLSGGTRQKVSACIAFLFNPQIILLDEPTAGLDPISADILREKIISERNKGKTIIITSHILSELDDVANTLVYFKDGTVLFKKGIIQLLEETQQHKLGRALAYYIKNLTAC
ncbi:MAG: ATP-binding cassette domain-containing protein [Bacteroidetes bacterium]|nr:ATP-binding cassette domain-containing protein [Bacteroidota bacterium]